VTKLSTTAVLPVLSIVNASELAYSLFRVSFQTVPVLGSRVLLTISAPESRLALLEERPVSEWPESTLGELPFGPDFDCLCVDASRAEPNAAARAEAWIDPVGTTVASRSVRLKLTDGWVRVKQGRAVVFASKKEWDAIAAALADFCFYDFELRKLERDIAAEWPRAEADLPLASDVASEDLRKFGEISAMTRSVLARRIRLAKLERPLLKCQTPLPDAARKLAARLRVKFDVEDRAETLDGQIEVYEYIYEMANQRMSEYKNFRREYLLEILIVILLAGELVFMVLEFFRK